MMRRPPRSPLFPYPTLFRSHRQRNFRPPEPPTLDAARAWPIEFGKFHGHTLGQIADFEPTYIDWLARTISRDPDLVRSEEHTSELQSQSNLACRLLLEKKQPDQRLPLVLPPTGHHVDRVRGDDERRLVPPQDVQARDRLRPDFFAAVCHEARRARGRST